MLCCKSIGCSHAVNVLNDYCATCTPVYTPTLPPVPEDPKVSQASAHYRHSYKGIKLDPYRIAQVYALQGGPREQIMKKCLRFTDKGQTEQNVVAEIRSALERWEQMLQEDAHDTAP